MSVRVPGARLMLVAALVAAGTMAVTSWLLRPPPRVVADPPVAPTPPTGGGPTTPVVVAPSAGPAAAPVASEPPPPTATTTDPDPSSHDEGLPVPKGNAVAGVVRDRGGRPVADAIVRRPGIKGGRSGRTTTDGVGAFRLVGLPPGRLPFEVVVPDGVPRTAGVGATTFEADAGATDVVVVVDVGLEVVLRWADPSPAPASVTVHVRRAPVAERLDPKLGADGTARLRGFAAGDRLVVWVPADAAGRSVLVRDAKPEGEVVLARADGLSIVGTAKASGDLGTTTVWAEEAELGVRVVGTLAADGRFEVPGLPDGTRWRVTATVGATDDDDPGRSVAVDDVRPGASVELDLAVAK